MNFGGLKVLMISSDRNILAPGSAVSERIKEYGALVEELHIVLLSDAAHGLKPADLGRNIKVYPTGSALKLLRPISAARLGEKIVYERKFVRGKSLITAQDPFECGWAAAKVKRKWRIPLEVQLHTDPFSPYFTGSLNNIRKRLARKVLRQADSIRVVSESLKSLLSATYSLLPTTINVLPIYIDKERIEEGMVTFDLHARFGWHFVILCVARLTAEKNLPLALRTLARVREHFPDTGLVIVGEGPELGTLERLARELKVEDHVAFVGWQEEVASYYKTANLFLQTSRFEGYGLALVEAGLSGLPVVTTPVGIAADLESGRDAIVCPQDDEEFMWRAAYDLIKDNMQRETLRMNLKRVLEQKLLSKNEYLKRLKENWERTSLQIQ